MHSTPNLVCVWRHGDHTVFGVQCTLFFYSVCAQGLSLLTQPPTLPLPRLPRAFRHPPLQAHHQQRSCVCAEAAGSPATLQGPAARGGVASDCILSTGFSKSHLFFSLFSTGFFKSHLFSFQPAFLKATFLFKPAFLKATTSTKENPTM